MIIVDANILVAAVLGEQVPRVLQQARSRGLALAAPEPQIVEAARVLIEKIGLNENEARMGLEAIARLVVPLAPEFWAHHEKRARQRLHARAQPDWPVLAAALSSGGGVWSHDRDFFGTGVAVWSSRNMAYAA
jgi:predicted nucleic acid-binding protein